MKKDYIKINCSKCGIQIEKPRHRIRGIKTYCKECKGKTLKLICPICKKEFNKWESQTKSFITGKEKHKICCSIKCKNIGLRVDWKDLTRRTLKQRWKKEFGEKDLYCRRCKYNKEFNIIIHHKIYIKNGGTGDIQNLEPLCLNCHGEEHYQQKDSD